MKAKQSGRVRSRPFACSACGKAFAVDGAAEVHKLTVDCLLAQVRAVYAARGWARAYSWSRTLEACGFPIERAPTHVAIIVRAEAPEPWRSCSKRREVEVPHDGPWAPKYAVEAAYLFTEVKITTEARREMILRAVEDEEFAAACAAARALGGKDAVAALVRGELKRSGAQARRGSTGGERQGRQNPGAKA